MHLLIQGMNAPNLREKGNERRCGAQRMAACGRQHDMTTLAVTVRLRARSGSLGTQALTCKVRWP